MILDVLSNSKIYTGLDLKFAKAFRFFEDNDVKNMPTGKYPIDGDNIFAIVQEYTTKPLEQCKFETHKKYIDIQCIVKGSEVIGWETLGNMKLSSEYNPDKDIAFFKDPESWTAIKLEENYFAVFYAEDAHKPGCMNGAPSDVRKVVIKIKL